jgi:AsmA protein
LFSSFNLFLAWMKRLMTRRMAVTGAVMIALFSAFSLMSWTIASDIVAHAISRQIQDLSGLILNVKGRSTVAFLPVPRLKLEDVTLSTPQGETLIESAQLRGEMRILPLISGKIELNEVFFNVARVSVNIDAEGHSSWNTSLALIRKHTQKLASSHLSHIRRLVFTNTTFIYRHDGTEASTRLENLNMIANWSHPDAPISLSGSLIWQGETVTVAMDDFVPRLFLNQGSSPLSLQLGSALGGFKMTAQIREGRPLRAAGTLNLEALSLHNLTRWSGVPLPLAPLIQEFAMKGDFDLQAGALAFPKLRLDIHKSPLEGALSAHYDGSRLGITGTLAADDLVLDPSRPLAPPLFQGQDQNWNEDQGWNEEKISLVPLTKADLDVRLSARQARINGMKGEDIAANLLVKQGKIDASLSRASLHRGTLKTRMTLQQNGENVEAKIQGSFDHLDTGGLLAALGQGRWVQGTGSGHFMVESKGAYIAEWVHALQGRASLVLKQGEIFGIALNETLRRIERNPLSASIDWRQGRTSFESAAINLTIAKGIGEINDSILLSPTLRAGLSGQILFPERSLALKVNAQSQADMAKKPFLVFDMTGPWSDIALTPDVRALLQRSDAAAPLLQP